MGATDPQSYNMIGIWKLLNNPSWSIFRDNFVTR